MKKFTILFLILAYGCSYYLYDQEVKGAAQNMFDSNFDRLIKVTGVSFDPLAPICLTHKVIVSFKSKSKQASVPMTVTGCALTPSVQVEMSTLYAIRMTMSGF